MNKKTIEPIASFPANISTALLIEQWWDAEAVTLEEVKELWLTRYHPIGYGTDVIQIGDFVDVGCKRVLITKMTRYASCD